jgi:hypothetical protein
MGLGMRPASPYPRRSRVAPSQESYRQTKYPPRSTVNCTVPDRCSQLILSIEFVWLLWT